VITFYILQKFFILTQNILFAMQVPMLKSLFLNARVWLPGTGTTPTFSSFF